MPIPDAEKQKVINAVNALGRRVTVADVAAKTGLSLSLAGLGLNLVASETGGNLQVATTGDIVYSFSPGFQNAYLAKGIQRLINTLAGQIFRLGYFLLRISFGIMLILSLVIVVCLVIAVMLSMRTMSDRDSQDRDGFDFSFFDFMILRDLFFWGTYASYPDPYGYRPAGRKAKRKGNFLLDCFSFLFGDGNPNQGLEAYQWQLLADVIRAQGGVCTAEQLAPYTGYDPKNEDGVLPVLVRFEGSPEVTETGNIVYVFPKLQVSAQDAQAAARLPDYLEERTWKFTEVPIDSLVPVFILAGINFAGSFWLLAESHINMVLASFVPLIQVLVLYGTAFIAVPLVRFLALKFLNAKIEGRNTRLREYARLIKSPQEAQTAKKLEEAKHYQIENKQIGKDNIVYSTEEDLIDQEFDRPKGN